MESDAARAASEYLDARGASFVRSILHDSDQGVLVVTVDPAAVAARVSTGKTSRRQLSLLEKEASQALGINVKFAVLPHAHELKLEEELRVLLRAALAIPLRDVFFGTSTSGRITVWVHPQQESTTIPSRTWKSAESLLKEHLATRGLRLDSLVRSSTSARQPGLMDVLKAVKASQPADTVEIVRILSTRGFAPPPPRWLTSTLDLLRKRRLLVRQPDGTFVVTSAALSAIPHRRDRGSSDIDRALALGRRRW